MLCPGYASFVLSPFSTILTRGGEGRGEAGREEEGERRGTEERELSHQSDQATGGQVPTVASVISARKLSCADWLSPLLGKKIELQALLRGFWGWIPDHPVKRVLIFFLVEDLAISLLKTTTTTTKPPTSVKHSTAKCNRTRCAYNVIGSDPVTPISQCEDGARSPSLTQHLFDRQ